MYAIPTHYPHRGRIIRPSTALMTWKAVTCSKRESLSGCVSLLMTNQYIEDDYCLETGKIVSWSGGGNALVVLVSLSYVVDDVSSM